MLVTLALTGVAIHRLQKKFYKNYYFLVFALKIFKIELAFKLMFFKNKGTIAQINV